MSKQDKSRPNVTTIAFLLLVVSIGFPFQSLPLIDFDVNFKVESDLQIANLFLGNGFVGKSIFEPSTYDNQNIMPFAHAVNGSAPVITLSNLTSTEYYQDEYIEYGATISDAEDGDLSEQLILNYDDFTNTIGNNTIHYEVTDSDSHFVQENRTVTIIEKPPVISNSTTFFDNATYQSQEDADPIKDIKLGRDGVSTSTKQIGDRKFVTSSMTSKWLEDGNGGFIERVVSDDVNGVKFQSALFSYYYDKDQCGMTVHDVGMINENSTSYIKYNGWVAKSALNGTDNWVDLPQNELPCTVSVIENSEKTEIISVRGDSDGEFTESYVIAKPLSKMKTTLSFFNNNTALNDHKIAFTNVLTDTPDHYRFLIQQDFTFDNNGTDTTIKIPMLSPYSTSPLTAPIEYGIYVADIPTNGEINISRDDFQTTYGVNATENPLGYVITDTGFSMDYYSEAEQSWNPVRYEFTNDAMEKLWNVKVINNQLENNVYIDYMNINNVTSVGETATLDPSVTTSLTALDTRTITYNSYSATGGGSGCLVDAELPFTTDLQYRHLHVGTGFGGRLTFCDVPIITFDVTAVPDDASILELEFSYTIDTHLGCAWADCNENENNWWFGNNEDVRGFDGESTGDTFSDFANGQYSKPDNLIGENMFFNTLDPSQVGGVNSWYTGYGYATTFIALSGMGDGNCDDIASTTSMILPCLAIGSIVDPNTMTDRFETALENGKNIFTLAGCNYPSIIGFNPPRSQSGAGDVATGGYCTTFRNSDGTGTRGYGIDESTILFDVTWEIFLPASAPTLLTCQVQGSDLFLDWSVPNDTGGTNLTGYTVYRSSGGSFQLISTQGVTPSNYLDNSGILAGILYTYRVHALNDLGEGAFAEIGCGLAGLPSNPLNLTATGISLGVVALDWNEPSFTGNAVLTGYKIDRTTGTPSTSNDWTLVMHHKQSGYPPQGADVVGTDIRILDVGDSTGHYRLQGVSDTTVEGLFMSTTVGNGGVPCTHNHYGYPYCTGNTYLFKDFDKEELKERKITWRWDQFKIPSGNSVQTFGQVELRAIIVDGVYDMTDANLVGGTGTFVANVAPIGNELMHMPPVGNGLVEDCLDTNNNAVVTLGSAPFVATLPNVSQMEATNQHQVTCTVDPALIDSIASQDRVTVVFIMYDEQAGAIGCGSNCASGGEGSMVLDYIDIGGMGYWDFTNDLPLDTELNLIGENTNPANLINLDTNPVLDIVLNNFVIGDGFITLVPDTGNLLTEYLDNTVEELTNYGYRVFAINSEGIGDPSNTAIVFTAGAPSAPNPVATPTGTQSINLSWAIPDLNGGTVVDYEIQRKTGTGGILSFLDSTTNTSYDDGTGLFTLAPATEYCYIVKVTTNVGSSPFSADACATTFDAPSAPLNLQVIALDGSSVDMSFDTPASDGGSPITGYKVERKLGAGSFVTLDASTFIQFRNDTGLPIGTLITYRVSASNQFGLGDPATASDTTDATPQVPQNLVCSASTPDSINLSWQTPVTFSPPTGYQISRNISGGAFSVLVANTASTGTTYNDTPLSLDTIYGYEILAHTPEGDTLATPQVFCQTLKAPDAPPENFKANFSQTLPHDVTLSWDIPNLFGIAITSITVERDDGAGYVTLATLPSNAVGMIDANPNNDVQQKYRIKMTGSLGDSQYGFAVPSDVQRISHFNFEKTITDSGDEKNSATVTGLVNFTQTGHAGTNAFDYDGISYITVDVAQESDYDFDRLTPFGATLYYSGTDPTGQQALVSKSSGIGGIGWNFYLDNGLPTFRMNGATQSLIAQSTANVTDGTLHFIGFSHNGNSTIAGVDLIVDGAITGKTNISDTLTSETILNNLALTFGATSSGTNILQSITDDIMIFGDGLDGGEVIEIAFDEIETVAPINATMSLTGSTFANISSEQPTITLLSGFPSPSVSGTLELKNFTTTTVNTVSGLGVIPTNGILNVPAMFNQMGSLSNYTTLVTLDNGLEVFVVISSEDLQSPLFSLPAGIEFFFQQQRINNFEDLSFNFTKTSIPFDLACNLKSELFEDGVTFEFENVGFLTEIFDVPRTKDVVVACIDQNSPLLNVDEPSFGGSNALLTFVSFGDTTGIGAFLNFTDNYGDFFGAPLPYLFIILAAALFTGRSAPTGIIVIGVALGIMWYLGLLVIDPVLWGIIVVLIILGAIGGKKFL